MGLRAKRVALQAQVTGTTAPGTGPAEGTGLQDESPSPRTGGAVSTSSVSDTASNAGAKDSRAIAREKLDKVVTGGDQSIKADHPNNKLRSNSFDDSVRLIFAIFWILNLFHTLCRLLSIPPNHSAREVTRIFVQF